MELILKVIIIPAVNIKITAIIISLIYLYRNMYASIAPNGSAKHDKKVEENAFLNDLVPKYIGNAIHIPSGILWNIIAKLNFIPIFKLVTPDKKVTIPSGKLWTIKAIKDNIPNFKRLFSPSIFLSKIFIIKYPAKNEEIIIIKALRIEKLFKIVMIEFGKRSIIDIKIITVPEKAKMRLILDFLPILGINTNKEPKTVPNEAKKDNKIGINIFIIYIY